MEKNVEPSRAKLFGETKANSISASSYEGPGGMRYVVGEVARQGCRPQEVNKNGARKVEEHNRSCEGADRSEETYN